MANTFVLLLIAVCTATVNCHWPIRGRKWRPNGRSKYPLEFLLLHSNIRQTTLFTRLGSCRVNITVDSKPVAAFKNRHKQRSLNLRFSVYMRHFSHLLRLSHSLEVFTDIICFNLQLIEIVVDRTTICLNSLWVIFLIG